MSEKQYSFFDDEVDVQAGIRDVSAWPEPERFPHNFSKAKVESVVLNDLANSASPLIVTGFTSLDYLIDFLADLPADRPQTLRLLIGSEPTHSKGIPSYQPIHARIVSTIVGVPERSDIGQQQCQALPAGAGVVMGGLGVTERREGPEDPSASRFFLDSREKLRLYCIFPFGKEIIESEVKLHVRGDQDRRKTV